MMIPFFFSLFLVAPLASAAQVDLGEIWSQIVWCGSKNDKALVCHHAGGSSYQEICISLNALKRGHLTAESGVTRLHGDDTFGRCGQTPTKETIIFPCNAAIKTPQLASNCQQIGDSLTCHDSSNDFISTEAIFSSVEITSFIEDMAGDRLRIPSHPLNYQEISSTPFSTQLIDEQLNFNLHSANYGSNYSVDWCIRQFSPKSGTLNFSLTIAQDQYLRRSSLVSRFELWCGDHPSQLQKIDWSETTSLGQYTQYQHIGLPAQQYCLWRQKFFEISSGIRPWSLDQLNIIGELQSN